MDVNKGGRLAELMRVRLYISWSMKRAVGERASARDKTVISYISELAK
jgi:hypothetical protein